MKLLFATLAAIAAFAVPAVADANQTTQIPGFNCSVTAYTPTFDSTGPTVNATTGVSCGGSEAGYAKTAQTELVELVTGGWQYVTQTGWAGWFYGNPLRQGITYAPCIPGRWYAVVSTGRVDHNGIDSGAQASSQNSGGQCP